MKEAFIVNEAIYSKLKWMQLSKFDKEPGENHQDTVEVCKGRRQMTSDERYQTLIKSRLLWS